MSRLGDSRAVSPTPSVPAFMKGCTIARKPLQFWAGVALLRSRGMTELGRYRCQVTEKDGHLLIYLLSNRFEPLPAESDDAELPHPEFWMPVGNNGEHREPVAVVPRWMGKRHVKRFWSDIQSAEKPKAEAYEADPTDRPIFSQSRAALMGMATVRRTEQKPDDERSRELAREGLILLNRAIFLAHQQGGLQPQADASQMFKPLSEMQLMPALTPELAEILHLAFQAGELSARASNHYNRNPETVRRGAVLVKGQTKRAGRKGWRQCLKAICASDPKVSVDAAAGALEKAGWARVSDLPPLNWTISVREVSGEIENWVEKTREQFTRALRDDRRRRRRRQPRT